MNADCTSLHSREKMIWGRDYMDCDLEEVGSFVDYSSQYLPYCRTASWQESNFVWPRYGA